MDQLQSMRIFLEVGYSNINSLKLFQLACETLPTVPRTTAVCIRKKAVISEKRPGPLVKVLGFGEVCWFGRAARHWTLSGFCCDDDIFQSAFSFLGGGFKYVLFSSLFGEDSHFGYYFFQMGWNHQPDSVHESCLHFVIWVVRHLSIHNVGPCQTLHTRLPWESKGTPRADRFRT